MPEPREHRVTIYDRASGGDRNMLAAVVTAAGDLVFEGQDIGPGVEKFFGDSDYEYWHTVKAEHVPVHSERTHLILAFNPLSPG